MSQRYAVVDIETTGGDPRRDKITEIGIVIMEDQEQVDKYSTLINPERSIPEFITRITGITNEMVASAPKFYEVAKEIVQKTEGAIFVAHNVRFDYQFLQNEFKQLGYTFSKRKLCTVRLSRRVWPGLPSYSLGNLIKHFEIEVSARHRALDDAYAASEVLKSALESANTKKEIRQLVSEGVALTRLPTQLKQEDILTLPEECGVYYFKDAHDNIVYIGKSKSIQKRVKQHFSKEGRKANRLFREVAQIDTVITGSELLSLLHESMEIKKHKPPINVAQKTTAYPYRILSEQLDDEFITFAIVKQDLLLVDGQELHGRFTKKKYATDHLKWLSAEYELCNQKVGLEKKSDAACFLYEFQKCMGACVGEESLESYNLRALAAKNSFRSFTNANFIIIEESNNIDEIVVFIIADNKFQGYGYASSERSYTYQDLEQSLHIPSNGNEECEDIIRQYMGSRKNLRIVFP